MIGHVDLISDMRRDLIGKGKFSGPPAKALQQIGNQSNPYGRPNADRLAWPKVLMFQLSNRIRFRISLFGRLRGFVRSTGAESRARDSAVAEKSRCEFRGAWEGGNLHWRSGPAIGDQFLFQERAQANIDTLGRRRAKKIVTACPHCHNTLKNEYPQFGGQYEVQHHSALLAELIAAGHLTNKASANGGPLRCMTLVTWRASWETEATRAVLRSSEDEQFREMPRCGKKLSAVERVGDECGLKNFPPSASPTCGRRKQSPQVRRLWQLVARFV